MSKYLKNRMTYAKSLGLTEHTLGTSSVYDLMYFLNILGQNRQ